MGVSKLVPLKMNNTALENSLSSHLFAARPALTDAELSPHHRLKIPSKSIQHDFEVIAMRNKQLSISNTEQRLPITRESFQKPRATKLKQSETSAKTRRNHVERNKRFGLLNERKYTTKDPTLTELVNRSVRRNRAASLS